MENVDIFVSVPKAVVFDVPLEDTDETDIIRRHPPKRLQVHSLLSCMITPVL